MKKKMSYRKSKKGMSEQYNLSINQCIIKNMGITEKDREVILFFDRRNKQLIIRKLKKN